MARSGNFINFREVSARLLLRPGRYIVVPSTYDPGYGGDYMLRVLEEHEWGILRQPVIDTHAVQVFVFHKQKSGQTIPIESMRELRGDFEIFFYIFLGDQQGRQPLHRPPELGRDHHGHFHQERRVSFLKKISGKVCNYFFILPSGNAGRLNEMYRWTEDGSSEQNLLNRMFREIARS